MAKRKWWGIAAPIAAVMVIIVICVRIGFLWKASSEENEALQAAAEKLEMDYVGSCEELVERCVKLPQFGLPVGVDRYKDVLRRDCTDFTAYIFTHARLRDTTSTHYSPRVYNTTLWGVHIKVTRDMPYWCIYPRGSDAAGLYDTMKSQIVKLPDSHFNSQYVLWSSKPDVAGKAIGRRARALLAEHPGWCVEGRGSMIIFHRPCRETEPDGYAEPLRLTIEFMQRVFGKKTGQ